MSKHTIKGLRAQFKAVGKFHTPPELALKLRSYIPGEPGAVYDPTCGAGALLSVFPDHVLKYGQDIDAEALKDAAALPNFHGHIGDVLTNPAWLDQRFEAIVANPPFSIPWEPIVDERFMEALTVPTKGRADFAFLLHILYMLADGGTAAVLSFPGVLYRSGREQQLRAWIIELNVVDEVVAIPGDTFEDTTISTAIIVLKKGRESTDIRFTDDGLGLSETVTLEQIRDADYSLSVNQFVHAPEPEKEAFDAWGIEQAARRGLVRKLRAELEFSRQVAEFEGWDLGPLLADVEEVIREFGKEDKGEF